MNGVYKKSSKIQVSCTWLLVVIEKLVIRWSLQAKANKKK